MLFGGHSEHENQYYKEYLIIRNDSIQIETDLKTGQVANPRNVICHSFNPKIWLNSQT